jgi:NAD(P)H-dependent FMN reductase
MSEGKKVLLIVGSPKGKNSTSESLGLYLLDRLRESGMTTEVEYIYPAVRKENNLDKLVIATDCADLIVLSFPLYVDSIPAGTIRALEAIAEHRKSAPVSGQKFAAICQSGFPEALHNKIAVEICRLFARDADMEWMGALTLGGGGVVSGKPLKEAGGMVRNVIKALDLAAADLATGSSISEEARSVMSQPLMPKWLYMSMGNLGWYIQAAQNKVLFKLNARAE